jgi:chromosome segregation ATPase
MENAPNSAAAKGDLVEFRTELKSDMAGLRAELKGDFGELRSVMRRDFDELKVSVLGCFDAAEHRLEQFLSDMEGRIITSNYRLAESMQQRIKQGEGNQAAFNARLATLEERLLEVEKRLNIPPAA